MNFIELGKYLQERVEYIYFNCIFTCEYGDSFIESARGTTRRFIMWQDIIIWETGVLEIRPHPEKGTVQEKVLNQIFELLDLKFFHALGTNEFGQVKDYYQIKGIKFQEECSEIEIIEDLDELEEVVDEEINTETDEIINDDLEYIIKMDLQKKYIEIEKHYKEDIKNGLNVFGE